MSIIATRIALTQLVTTQRLAADGTDTWGGPGEQTWADNLIDVPCIAWVDSDNSASDERAAKSDVIVKTDRRMLVPLGTDITEADRVGDITDRGVVFLDGPMGVQAVLPTQAFLEVSLRRIR